MHEMSELGPVGKIMESKLKSALSPARLELIDESNQHHGHAGAHPSGEIHFRLKNSAAAALYNFNGQGMDACLELRSQNLVNHAVLCHTALAAEFRRRNFQPEMAFS